MYCVIIFTLADVLEHCFFIQLNSNSSHSEVSVVYYLSFSCDMLESSRYSEILKRTACSMALLLRMWLELLISTSKSTFYIKKERKAKSMEISQVRSIVLD